MEGDLLETVPELGVTVFRSSLPLSPNTACTRELCCLFYPTLVATG